MLSLPELLQVTKSSGNEITIDLSSVSIDLYQPIRNALLKYGVSKIRQVNFNCNMRDTHASALEHRRLNIPPELEGSIALQLPNFESEISALISRLLFRTKRLNGIAVKSINFSYQDIDVICQGIEACRTIRKLKFVSLPLNDEGFERLAAALRHRSLTQLTCKKCNLSDDIVAFFRPLVKFHTGVQQREVRTAEKEKRKTELVALTYFDLRGNRFTSFFVDGMNSVIDRSPISRFDLRDNPGIPQSIHASPKFEFGSTRKNARRTSADDNLRSENEHLKGRLHKLLGKKNIAAVTDTVFIVGKRAPELADHIFSLDRLFTQLQNEQNRRSSRKRVR